MESQGVLIKWHDIPQEYRCILNHYQCSKHHLCIAIMDVSKNGRICRNSFIIGKGISGQYKEKLCILGRAEWCGVTHDQKIRK